MTRTSTRGRWLVAVVVVLGVVAAACGSSSSKSSSSGSTTPTAPKLAAATVKGDGSTFQAPLQDQMRQAFHQAQPSVTVNYQGVGSGQGKKDFGAQLVDFAGTDSLVKPAEQATFKGGPFLYFPFAAAPITVSYKVTGVDKLDLSAPTIAKIFQRQITKWDDPAIKAENPTANLPSTDITVAHRSDGSGTTSNFTKFLTKAAPGVWTLGQGDTVQWPADTVGGNGNPGVVSAVQSKEGTIGYVDFSDAKAANLKFASIKSQAGKYVAPSLAGTVAALGQTPVNADLTYDPIYAPGATSYPIATPTWMLVYKTQTDKAVGNALKGYLQFIYGPGQKLYSQVDYAQLPASMVTQAKSQIDQIVVPA